jgi:flagellum-specific peptidoglycan hydrolase FlgJ
MKLTNNPKNNIKLLKDLISKEYVNPIMQDVCLTQAVHESGLLNHPSKLASQYNNLFGIKGKGLTNKTILLPTWEMVNGKVVRIKAPFAFNDNLSDSIKQHKALMNRPRYSRVKEAKTLDSAFKALYDCGYATDVGYASKLMAVYNQIQRILNE